MKELWNKYFNLVKANKGVIIEKAITVAGAILGALVVAMITRDVETEELQSDAPVDVL